MESTVNAAAPDPNPLVALLVQNLSDTKAKTLAANARVSQLEMQVTHLTTLEQAQRDRTIAAEARANAAEARTGILEEQNRALQIRITQLEGTLSVQAISKGPNFLFPALPAGLEPGMAMTLNDIKSFAQDRRLQQIKNSVAPWSFVFSVDMPSTDANSTVHARDITAIEYFINHDRSRYFFEAYGPRAIVADLKATRAKWQSLSDRMEEWRSSFNRHVASTSIMVIGHLIGKEHGYGDNWWRSLDAFRAKGDAAIRVLLTDWVGRSNAETFGKVTWFLPGEISKLVNLAWIFLAEVPAQEEAELQAKWQTFVKRDISDILFVMYQTRFRENFDQKTEYKRYEAFYEAIRSLATEPVETHSADFKPGSGTPADVPLFDQKNNRIKLPPSPLANSAIAELVPEHAA